MIRVDGRRAGKADVGWNQRPEELASKSVLSCYLVVDELEAADAGDFNLLLDLFYDVTNWSCPVGAIVKHRYFAKRATVGTSASRLDRQGLKQIAIELEQLMARARQAL